MKESKVYMLMRDDNDLGCSLAVVDKDVKKVLIVLKDSEVAIYDFDDIDYGYLLLKHYPNDTLAYKDFLKLVGKMCKKSTTGKYFLNHIDEDNRMVFIDDTNEHMIDEDEKKIYNERFENFINFVSLNRGKFIDFFANSN